MGSILKLNIVLLLFVFQISIAEDGWDSYIPNGNYVYTGEKTKCQICHEFATPDISTNNLNGFGTDLFNSGMNWNKALADKDSDNDGYSNMSELNCSDYNWISGPCGSGLDAVVNPGDPSIMPTIAVENAKVLDAAMPLLSVSPNPFNPMVNIVVSCKELEVRSFASDFSIKIYNIKGILVKNLSKTTNSFQLTPNSFIWNASQHPSGIYIVRLQMGGKVYSKQIVLSK